MDNIIYIELEGEIYNPYDMDESDNQWSESGLIE